MDQNKTPMQHNPSLLRIFSSQKDQSKKISDREFRRKSIVIQTKRSENNGLQQNGSVRHANSFDYGLDNIANEYGVDLVVDNFASDFNTKGAASNIYENNYDSITPGYTYSNGISPIHKQNNDKHKGRKTKEQVQVFCEKTTAHGWGRVIQEKLNILKGLWLVLTIAAYICNGLHVSLLVQQYLSYPSEQVTRVELQSIEFPSVTVCNLQPMSFSTGLEMISNSSTKLFYWTQLTTDYFKSGSPAVENMTEERKEYLFNRVRQPIGYFENLEEEYQQVGHQPRDFILRCTFASRDCVADNFTFYTSPTYFNCYTFNGGNTSKEKLETRSTGPQQGLSLILYLESDNGDQLYNGTYHTLSSVANAAGARVVIHPPDTRPSPVDKGFDIPPGYSSSIGLKVSEYTRLGKPYGECVEDTFFNSDQYVYSSHDCLMQCQQQFVMDNCRCISSTLPVPENPYNLTYCGRLNPEAPQFFFDNLSCEAAEMEKFSSNEKMRDLCGCYPPCMELSYAGDVSYSYWPLDFAQQSFYESYVMRHSLRDDLKAYNNLQKFSPAELISQNMIRKNFIRLNVFLKDLVIDEVEQKQTYALQNLLSDMGGTFGLWIGVSILSWCEIIEFICVLSYKGVRFFCKKLEGENVKVVAWNEHTKSNE